MEKKRMIFKKGFSFIACIAIMLMVTAFCTLSVAAAEENATISEEKVYERIMAQKENYPEGMTWTNDNQYKLSVTVDEYYITGYGCAGFAFILSDAGFGEGQFPARKYYEYDDIRVGDILRISNDTHSVVVLSIAGDVVTIAEGNYNNSIHWGRTLSLTQLQNGEIDYGITRYPVEYSEGTSGYCGNEQDGINLSWELSENGVLTIKGIGKMKNWSGRTGREAPWFVHRDKIKKVVIGEGVTHIGDCAFSSCVNLVDVTVPNTVVSIGADAFYCCESLVKFEMPDSVVEVDSGSFYDCTSLVDVNLSNKLTALSSRMFAGCTALKEIQIPESVTTLGGMVFNRCKNLHYLYVPNTVTTIIDPYQNFANIAVLCEDNAPVMQYAEDIELLCPRSKWKGTCGDDLTYSFDWNTKTLTLTGTGEVPYDDSLRGAYVFAGYSAVKNIELKDFTGTELPTYFYGWPSVESFEIPNTVTLLDYNTFADCDSLKYVVVPASVERIRSSFWGNSEDFEIRGYSGTAIEAYATENGLKFVSLDTSQPSDPTVTPNPSETPDATPSPDFEAVIITDDGPYKWACRVNGQYNTNYTGLALLGDKWCMVVNDCVDFTYTSPVFFDDEWWFVRDGLVEFDYNGLVFVNDDWWYVVNGRIDFSFNGLAYVNDAWWYVSTGRIDFSYTGLIFFDDAWWFVQNGCVNFGYTGLAFINDNWWYVVEGKIDFSYCGLFDYDNQKWYVQGGMIDFSYNNVYYFNDIWYYIETGKVNYEYNGLAYTAFNDKWWYVINGVISFDYTGAAYANEKYWYVESGEIDFQRFGKVTIDGVERDVALGEILM